MTDHWSWGLVSLAVAGGAISLLFIAAERRRFSTESKWLPRFCRLDHRDCAHIIGAREARPLGVSNSVLGMVWYAIVLAAGATMLAGSAIPELVCRALLIGAGATVLLGAYLVWALLAKIKVPCALCFACHAINGAIAWGLLVTCRGV